MTAFNFNRPRLLKNDRNLYVLRRPPNQDEFTFELLIELLESMSYDFEAYYIWSNPPSDLEAFLTTREFSRPNVVIGIKDTLDMWTEFNYWQDTVMPGVALLDRMAQQHPDKNFVVFTSLENIKAEPVTADNLQFVQWGGDLSNQAALYQVLEPVLDKNFDSQKTFISLNRNRREHRLVTLSYLFGLGYDQHGYISYLSQRSEIKKLDSLLDCIPWQFLERQEAVRDHMMEGYKIVNHNKDLYVEDYNIYRQTNDNITNFNSNLRPLYQNSFFEIVSETEFSSPSFLVTEKTANAIYACNFFIILSGQGAVQHFKDIGFDMFDDVIDHSYDSISNPIDRIALAIDRNQRLFTDPDYVKDAWIRNQHRFESNITVANEIMFDWYRDRARQQFDQIKWRT